MDLILMGMGAKTQEGGQERRKGNEHRLGGPRYVPTPHRDVQTVKKNKHKGHFILERKKEGTEVQTKEH